MASRGIGTRRRPTSPLQLGVTDPENIIKTARKLRRSQSLPASCDPHQLGDSLDPAKTSPWIKPTIPESTFQVFTNPEAFLKAKTASPGKIPLFQLKVGKSPFQASSSQTSSSSKPQSKMAAQNPPMDMMDRMVAARYAPLVLPQPLHALPGGDYQKYMPRFNGQGETTTEEHWEAFLSYADNQNIEIKDVWMRVFVQILDGDLRKWFKEFPANSITIIEELQDLFLR